MKFHQFKLLAVLVAVASILFGCNSPSDSINIGNQDDNAGQQSAADSSASSADTTNTDQQDSAIDPSIEGSGGASGRVWSVSEILSEERSGGSGGTPECGGELGFKRCLCPENVPSSVRYRPAVTECNGNAAAIFYDQYLSIFSVVMRDSQNRDRWPASGFGGCSAQLANSDSPPNRCSAFKVQEKFSIGGGIAVVHCFGASGYSSLFSDVTRLTIKLEDSPNSSNDPLERFCLFGPDRPLN